MTDREKMIEVINLAKEDFARETASYLEFGDEIDLIADRLLEAGFGRVNGEVIAKRVPCPKCGKMVTLS